MADEQLVPDGDEALELAPDGGDPPDNQADETPEPIVNLAMEMGWLPKDQFRGDPDAWKPADQFIRAGRDIQQTTARELRSMREQVERMGSVTETIVRDKEAEINARWEAKIAQAAEDGDTALAVKLAKERPVTSPANGGPDPTVQQWVAKNQWFTSDPLAKARAEEISNRLAHLPVPDQLAQVERAIRKEYPELFPTPAKQPPATQTGSTRSAAPSNRVKGFAEMPLASQQVALDYEKRLGVPKEQTAKSYWAEQQGVKR